MLPTGFQQIAILSLFVVPGFVFHATRSRFRGPTPDDREFGVRVLRALGVSAVLALLYIVSFGQMIIPRIQKPLTLLDNPRTVAILGLGLIFVFPAFLGAIAHIRWAHSRIAPFPLSKRIRNRQRQAKVAAKSVWKTPPNPWKTWWRATFRSYSPTPTAWDHMGPGIKGFVRVLTKGNQWIGGFAGPRRFVSAYPESREMFLDYAYAMKEDGEFGDPIQQTAGIWINCSDVVAVQLLGTGGDQAST